MIRRKRNVDKRIRSRVQDREVGGLSSDIEQSATVDGHRAYGVTSDRTVVVGIMPIDLEVTAIEAVQA